MGASERPVQLDLFPEISGIQGRWLVYPYDFARLPGDLEAYYLEYTRYRRQCQRYHRTSAEVSTFLE